VLCLFGYVRFATWTVRWGYGRRSTCWPKGSSVRARTSVGPAVLQTVFDPKAAMAGFGLLRLQSPRDALLVRWEQQFRVCSTDVQECRRQVCRQAAVSSRQQ
jgi:hypothetical protein